MIARIAIVSWFIGLGLLIHFSHGRLVDFDRSAPKKIEFIPSVQAVRIVSLGYDQLMADCYWLAFIGYVGDRQERRNDHYELADRYLDLVTGLDPGFVNAYWFAAFIVGGDQGRPARAAELIDRGVQANPDNWYLPFIAGFNQYMFAKDHMAAAKYYDMASKFPDAPQWLGRQAKILRANIPALIKEINVLTNVFESAQDDRLKEMAREKLIRLWLTVYKSSPEDGPMRGHVSRELYKLGVDVHLFGRRP